MSKTVLFYAPGFEPANARLQPWRYVYELASYLGRSHRVVVLTDCGAGDRWSSEETFEVLVVAAGISRMGGLLQVITDHAPDQLWWSATRRSFVYYWLYRRCVARIGCEIVLYITSPFYRLTDLLRAMRAGVPLAELRTLLLQCSSPWCLFRRVANAEWVRAVVVQSQRNRAILKRYGIETAKTKLLRVGIDPLDADVADSSSEPQPRAAPGAFTFLYMGAIRAIRGFPLLQKSFGDVVAEAPHARLAVLARGASEADCAKIRAAFAEYGVEHSVTVVGGWLRPDEIRAQIDQAHAIVLPFVLVPSDVPVAALEALARGKPIVVSAVDGLPELAEGRGVVVDPTDRRKLVQALAGLANDREAWERTARAARQFMRSYPTWAAIGEEADALVAGDGS